MLSFITRRTLLAIPVLLGIMVVGAALTGPAIYGAWSTVGLDEPELDVMLSDVGLAGGSWVLFIVYYSVVNPVLEELFWRQHLGSNRVGLVWTDMWFAGYHILVLIEFVKVPWVVAGFAALVGAAWLWRQVMRECDGLLIPVLSHSAADLSLIMAAFILAA